MIHTFYVLFGHQSMAKCQNLSKSMVNSLVLGAKLDFPTYFCYWNDTFRPIECKPELHINLKIYQV